MTLGEKISTLRKTKHYTQEQLADLLGVSRQSISKWESDIAYPETDKLIRMGKLFDCSMDYLLKEDCTEPTGHREGKPTWTLRGIAEEHCRERKSEKTVWGMPLYHIGRNAHGFFAVGLRAKGIFAVGLLTQGVVSLGALSVGILSLGILSLGLAAFGSFSLGLLAVGAIVAGIFAVGAISFGVISLGAISIGGFSMGALAIGKYLAIGDHAHAMIAIGKSEVTGNIYQYLDNLSPADIPLVIDLLAVHVPGWLSWAEKIARVLFLS